MQVFKIKKLIQLEIQSQAGARDLKFILFLMRSGYIFIKMTLIY